MLYAETCIELDLVEAVSYDEELDSLVELEVEEIAASPKYGKAAKIGHLKTYLKDARRDGHRLAAAAAEKHLEALG